MSLTAANIFLKATGLSRQEIAEVTTRAKRSGLSPEQYLREVIEDHLAIAREAKVKTLAQLSTHMRRDFARSGMTEAELDSIVERAKTKHRRSRS